jgi:hypothetical protein
MVHAMAKESRPEATAAAESMLRAVMELPEWRRLRHALADLYTAFARQLADARRQAGDAAGEKAMREGAAAMAALPSVVWDVLAQRCFAGLGDAFAYLNAVFLGMKAAERLLQGAPPAGEDDDDPVQ